MNRTKHEIIVAFWQLLEKKPYNKITVQDIVDHCHVNRNTFYYHFQDIPSLTEWSVETWSDEVIKNQVVFESLEHCILYMAEECMKRKKALLHLYRSSKKDYFLGYLNKVGNHVICTYIENRTGNMPRKHLIPVPRGTASNEMCTFLIINISSLQLIPVNVIAYRSQYGSVNPAAIVGAGIISTAISTAVAVIYCKIMDRS